MIRREINITKEVEIKPHKWKKEFIEIQKKCDEAISTINKGLSAEK